MKGPQHHGEEFRESDQQKARIGARLRAETTMTWGWIARELSMGHWRTAANAVRSARAAPRDRVRSVK